MVLTLLLSTDDVLEEVDGNLLVGRQVDAALHGTELKTFPFRRVLGGEGLRGDSVIRSSLPRNLGGVVLFHLIGFYFNNDRKIFSRLPQILWR